MSINMRQQFLKTITDLIRENENIIILFNDIGVAAFDNLKAEYPNRVHNLGIMEQASIGIAAGLSMTGYIPFFHTIAPFIVERGYEQLKDDFGYQNINGNFVSVGSSFDYSKMGMTHNCPAEVGALMQIPNMQIVLPGTAFEEDILIKSAYNNGSPTYFRLAEKSNSADNAVEFGKATVIRKGSLATIIAVGNMLDSVLQAVQDKDVTVLYYTTLRPFDADTLLKNAPNEKILLCEPYYSGALLYDIVQTFAGKPLQIELVGMSHEVVHTYGTYEENLRYFKMTSATIAEKLKRLVER